MGSLVHPGTGENYCDLVLYVGKCHADGLPPGRFFPDQGDPYSAKRLADALATIQRYLQPSRHWGLTIDYDNLVKNNAEADRLVRHALEHFPSAADIVEPHQCIHGKILFARKLRMPGCGEKDADAIVKVMKASGHVPNEFSRRSRWIRGHYHSEELVRERIHELEVEVDDIWRAALKFYGSHG